ncbi:hypothetical protein Cgig2_029877 [Carnegiea gigantea]|uniref:Reverse transcriptase zinc-binding domain-containing protein n=1 Tax=Carnegiea gigantea TaxID=171969 RepID=A0A9Q1K3L5_9CARY|nr:hypothetical protein Cgig2_029877 [Carnegiea gigantea]
MIGGYQGPPPSSLSSLDKPPWQITRSVISSTPLTAAGVNHLIKSIFLPCDVEVILSIPLCTTWPRDKLIWHYNKQVLFAVRSAYHMIICDRSNDGGSPSTRDPKLWRALWKCDVPPHIKLFGWRACVGSLPTSHNMSTRIPDFVMSCSVCVHAEDTPSHAILECPLALDAWHGSGIDEDFWTPRFRTLADCIANASHTLDDDAFGDFLAVMWECWNARNRFIFSTPDRNLATLGKRALDFLALRKRGPASTGFNAPMTMASAMSSLRATVSISSNCSKPNRSLITF